MAMTREDSICNTIGGILGIALWLAYWHFTGGVFAPP